MKNSFSAKCADCKVWVPRETGELTPYRRGLKLRCIPCYDKHSGKIAAQVDAEMAARGAAA